MENDILKHRKAVQENILKSFGAEVSEDMLEKAHNHGDVHSNGKWYWEGSANRGKGDWRTIKGAGKAAPATNSAKPQPKAEEKKEAPKKKVPSGKKVSYDDDIVAVYDDKGEKVYEGMLDYSPYRLDDSKWNEKDKNYDLPKGYKMVGK